MWNILNQDHLSAVAMIVEFVSYNGNMDMFTHARVKLDLLPTGLLQRQIDVVVFPLNVFNMGLTDFASECPGRTAFKCFQALTAHKQRP